MEESAISFAWSVPLPADAAFTLGYSSANMKTTVGSTDGATKAVSKILLRLSHSI